MPIQDLARDEVISASPETRVSELAEQMQNERVGSVVITNGNSPVGIATDRDLALQVLTGDGDPNEQTAEDVMSTDLCSVSPDAGFYEAAQTMSENGVRRLPVCDENNELVGIITADDLTELLAEESEQLANIIRSQRPAY